MENNNVIDLFYTNYGFRWGDILVERTCSIIKPRTIQILRVFCPNGEIIEIQASKRKTLITKHKKAKDDR